MNTSININRRTFVTASFAMCVAGIAAPLLGGCSAKAPSTAVAEEPFDEFEAWNIAQLRKEIAQRKADAEDVSAFA